MVLFNDSENKKIRNKSHTKKLFKQILKYRAIIDFGFLEFQDSPTLRVLVIAS